MPYYTQPYTNQNFNEYNRYPYHQNYTTDWHGNGWTAMNYANNWYPGWHAYSYQWRNNCWWVYLRKGNLYRTVYVGPSYNWHNYREGYWH